MLGYSLKKIVLKYLNLMRKFLFLLLILIAQSGCLDQKQQSESILRHYIDTKTYLIRNYWMESGVALWNATVSGNESDYKRLIDIDLDFNKTNQNASKDFAPDRFLTITQNVFTNEQDFELLRKLKYSGLITDTLLSRQLNVLYQAFMGPQIEPEKYNKIITNEIKLWQLFSTIKVKIDGKIFGAGQIDSIRKNSNDCLKLKKISDAIKQSCKLITPDIIRMVKDRNEFAVNFGYTDYYHLSLETQDHTPERIKLLLDEIELKTRGQFFEAKKVIDKMLAKRFRIPKNELQPWLYNDERTSYLPKYFLLKLDSLFANTSPVQKTVKFFEGIGIPIQNVINNSKLEDGPGKSNLTAMINIDFKNDIRLIAGIRNTHEGMIRMMHLGGHASHYTSISDQVPYLLKTPNSVLSEGIARYFENLASDYNWLKNEVNINSKLQKRIVLVCQHLRQVDRLFRCRKLLAMAEFEREIYMNPDQDLDLLWHNLNIKYLGLNFPIEDKASYWATNKFASNLTCTIHNLVLADIFAAQLQHSVENKVLKKTNGVFQNNKAVGEFLVENLYQYGNLLPWEKLVEKATGESLNTAYFVNELIGELK